MLWIKVSDRLPTHKDDYLIYFDKETSPVVGQWDGKEFYAPHLTQGEFYPADDVTYWAVITLPTDN